VRDGRGPSPGSSGESWTWLHVTIADTVTAATLSPEGRRFAAEWPRALALVNGATSSRANTHKRRRLRPRRGGASRRNGAASRRNGLVPSFDSHRSALVNGCDLINCRGFAAGAAPLRGGMASCLRAREWPRLPSRANTRTAATSSPEGRHFAPEWRRFAAE
jgi:hypothetical protein